jgi:hypothetical protein
MTILGAGAFELCSSFFAPHSLLVILCSSFSAPHSLFVIPANAGIQRLPLQAKSLDPSVRWDDDFGCRDVRAVLVILCSSFFARHSSERWNPAPSVPGKVTGSQRSL